MQTDVVVDAQRAEGDDVSRTGILMRGDRTERRTTIGRCSDGMGCCVVRCGNIRQSSERRRRCWFRRLLLVMVIARKDRRDGAADGHALELVVEGEHAASEQKNGDRKHGEGAAREVGDRDELPHELVPCKVRAVYGRTQAAARGL